MLNTNYDIALLGLFAPVTATATYTNSTGSTATLAAGTLVGRVVATNKILPQVSSATDGSQDPIGILAANYTVANGATVTLTFYIQGEFDASLITFGGSDTLATNITVTGVIFGTLGDRLAGKGMILRNVNQINYIAQQA